MTISDHRFTFARTAVAVMAVVVVGPQTRSADLTVTNASDVVNGNTGNPDALLRSPGADGISLREAVQACNNAPGPHSINFAASLTGQTIALTKQLSITQNGISIAGNIGSDGKPGITLDLSHSDVSNYVNVFASDFSWMRVRLTGVGVNGHHGLRIPGGGAQGPQEVTNIRVEGNEFIGSAPDANGISLSMQPDAVGARISHVRIVDNTFLHFTGNADGVLVGSSGTNCVIEDVQIEGNRFEDTTYPVELVPSSGGTNIRIQGIQIVRNTFTGCSQAVTLGIGNNPGYPTTTANQITDTVISDNDFRDNLGTGVSLGVYDNTNGNTVVNTRITRNTFLRNHWAITLSNLGGTSLPGAANAIKDTVISENILTSNSRGVSINGGGANTTGCQIVNTRIVQNNFSGQSGSGISLNFEPWGGTLPSTANKISDTTISQNTFTGNSDAIRLDGAGPSTKGDQILNTQISNNLITGSQPGAAVSLNIGGSVAPNSHDNHIDGVLIFSNTIADNPGVGSAISGGTSGVGNTIAGVKVSNTIFWNNAGGDIVSALAGDVSFTLTSDSRLAGKNGNFSADPKFVDAANGDFHLRAGSPAIDAGTSDGAPATDLEGRPRFDDPATPNTGVGTMNYFDIGAYEFAPPQNQSRLINLSVLTSLAVPNDTLTVGTVFGGAGTGGTKPLLVRAAGPSLGALGVTGALPDPKLDVFSGQTVVCSNDNWGGTTTLSAACGQVGAFAFASATSKDAAAYNPAMPAGAYTVQVSGVGGATGAVLAELYDATPTGAFTITTPRLINVSVLKQIKAGEILTVGFVVSGTTSKQVLIRAVGPTLGLAPFNVPGVMADPKLELFSGQTVIKSNNDWSGDSALATAFASVGAFTLSNAGSKDAALLVTLQPGNYTAQVTGVNGSTGLALVEVYEVP